MSSLTIEIADEADALPNVFDSDLPPETLTDEAAMFPADLRLPKLPPSLEADPTLPRRATGEPL